MSHVEPQEYERLALRNLELEGQVLSQELAIEGERYRQTLNRLDAHTPWAMYDRLRQERLWWPVRLRVDRSKLKGWRWVAWHLKTPERRRRLAEGLFAVRRWGIEHWYGHAQVIRWGRLALVLGERPDLDEWYRQHRVGMDRAREEALARHVARNAEIMGDDTREDR